MRKSEIIKLCENANTKLDESPHQYKDLQLVESDGMITLRFRAMQDDCISSYPVASQTIKSPKQLSIKTLLKIKHTWEELYGVK